MSLKQSFVLWIAVGLIATLTAGCGQSESTGDGLSSGGPELGSGSSQFEEAGGGGFETLPAASISPPLQQNAARGADQPAKGTPAWLVAEIDRVRLRSAPDTEDPARLRSHRKWKNEKIIELAQEAITLTHKDEKQAKLFDTAVQHLMEARLELAVQSGPDQTESERRHVEELYNDAESLFRRDPKSKAAAEAAFVRARFANISADRFAAAEPRWLEEFSRQARLFAQSFPQEEERAVQLLDAAGRSCELHFLRDEAIDCYALLDSQFPKTSQGRQAAAVLRRLNLPGRKLESLAGPTIDGGYARIDDYRGRIVVIAFWASHSRECVEQFPRLLANVEKWGRQQVSVLGISLDDDEAAAKRFAQLSNLKEDSTILWPDENRRSWKNPIVQYYGVRDIPQFWLLDAEGNVVDTLLSLDQLTEKLDRMLKSR